MFFLLLLLQDHMNKKRNEYKYKEYMYVFVTVALLSYSAADATLF